MDHTLAEQLAGLASRINSLTLVYSDSWATSLLDLQDKLTDLSNKAILKGLQASDENYQGALKQINEAIDIIGDGTKKLDKIEKIVDMVNKAIELAGKAIGLATHL